MKKGFSLPTETIIYIIVALLVLIVLLFIFQDQAKMFFESIRKFFGFVDTNTSKWKAPPKQVCHGYSDY